MTDPWPCIVATDPTTCVFEKVGFARDFLSSANVLSLYWHLDN